MSSLAAAAEVRVAMLTPLPPEPSGIADYSADLLPYLARHMGVDVYTDSRYAEAARVLLPDIRIRSYDIFDANATTYDAVIYQMNNGECSVAPYLAFMKHNGIIMLHDLNLAGIFGALAFGSGPAWRFFPLLAANESFSAAVKSCWRFVGTRRMPGKDDYWMSRAVIRRSRSIIVHNQFAFDYVRNVRGGDQAGIWKANHGAPLLSAASLSLTPADAKRQLGLEHYDFVVASFGVVDESKRFSAALTAFGNAIKRIPNSVFLFVGQYLEDHAAKVKALPFEHHVRLVGRVTMPEFYQYMVASDVCIALRYPSHGEASGPLLRLMSVGKPVAVSDYAQFKELPDDVVKKIAVGQEAECLGAWLVEMAQSPNRRAQLGMNAATYIQQNHSMEQCAEVYTEAVRAYISDWPARNR